jgi:hypothetical protein
MAVRLVDIVGSEPLKKAVELGDDAAIEHLTICILAKDYPTPGEQAFIDRLEKSVRLHGDDEERAEFDTLRARARDLRARYMDELATLEAQELLDEVVKDAADRYLQGADPVAGIFESLLDDPDPRDEPTPASGFRKWARRWSK